MRAVLFVVSVTLILGCAPQQPVTTTPAATHPAEPSVAGGAAQPAQPAPSNNRHTSSGGGGEVSLGDFTIGSGRQYAQSGKPSLFAGYTWPNSGDEQIQILYLVAFSFPANYKSVGSDGGPSGDGEKVSIRQTYTIDQREFRLELDVVLDAETKAPKAENWRINGEPIDAAKGRLMLVDFQSDPPAWQQLDVDFAKLQQEAGVLDSAEAAEKWIAKLRENSAAVDEKLR